MVKKAIAAGELPLKILHILDHSLPVHSGYAFRSQAIFLAQKRRGWEPVILTSPKHYESCNDSWEERENKLGIFTITVQSWFQKALGRSPRRSVSWLRLQAVFLR